MAIQLDPKYKMATVYGVVAFGFTMGGFTLPLMSQRVFCFLVAIAAGILLFFQLKNLGLVSQGPYHRGMQGRNVYNPGPPPTYKTHYDLSKQPTRSTHDTARNGKPPEYL